VGKGKRPSFSGTFTDFWSEMYKDCARLVTGQEKYRKLSDAGTRMPQAVVGDVAPGATPLLTCAGWTIGAPDEGITR
jgi:hypothetical protein